MTLAAVDGCQMIGTWWAGRSGSAAKDQPPVPGQTTQREWRSVNGFSILVAVFRIAAQEFLREIRAAAQADDKAAILQEIGLPLLYIDDEGNRRELTDPGDVDARFSEVFDQDVLALLRRIDLDGLTVVPDQGAFLELGSIWLVVDRKGGRPRIVTINKQALGEAGPAKPAQAPD